MAGRFYNYFNVFIEIWFMILFMENKYCQLMFIFHKYLIKKSHVYFINTSLYKNYINNIYFVFSYKKYIYIYTILN